MESRLLFDQIARSQNALQRKKFSISMKPDFFTEFSLFIISPPSWNAIRISPLAAKTRVRAKLLPYMELCRGSESKHNFASISSTRKKSLHFIRRFLPLHWLRWVQIAHIVFLYYVSYKLSQSVVQRTVFYLTFSGREFDMTRRLLNVTQFRAA